MAQQITPISRPSTVNINSNDQPSILKLTSVLASAFTVVPLNIGFICDEDKIPPPYPSPLVDTDRFYRHFEHKIKKIAASNAVMLQAGDWSGVVIWEPPNFKDPRASDALDPKRQLFVEWRARIKVVKAKYLSDPDYVVSEDSGHENVSFRPYYHLGFLARNPDIPTVQGTITALLEPFLQRARKEGVPVWLEASSPYAVGIYEHFGFRLVEVITIGIGKYGSDGWPKEGGEGINGYAMIYDGHLKK